MEVKRNFFTGNLKDYISGGDLVEDIAGNILLVTVDLNLVDINSGFSYTIEEIGETSLKKIDKTIIKREEYKTAEELFREVKQGDVVEDKQKELFIVTAEDSLISLEDGSMRFPLEMKSKIKYRKVDNFYIQEK